MVKMCMRQHDAYRFQTFSGNKAGQLITLGSGGKSRIDKCTESIIIPNKECALRYKYEKEADKYRDASTRNKSPYDKFTTFNFAIRREVFTSIFFNSGIKRYGYEDTLFGKELERCGYKIHHIDNKLLHNGLESSVLYLAKIEQSLITLKEIEKEIGSTPLLNAVATLRQWKMEKTFLFFWCCTKRLMRRNLTGSNPSLKIFNIYKLGYFLSLR